MTFEKQGFLSSELSSWVDKHRKDAADWFQLADDINKQAQAIACSLSVESSDRRSLVMVLLFLRGLSSFQAAVLLTERGLTTESRTLSRSCFETIFYLGALHHDESFLRDMIGEDADKRLKIARALVKLPDGSGFDADDIEHLNSFIKNVSSALDASSIGIETAAKKAQLHPIYDTYYRGLCHDSSHPSLISLGRHLEVSESGNTSALLWSPEAADIDDTLSIICTAGFYLLAFAADLEASGVSTDFHDTWQTYKSLIGSIDK